MCIRDSPCADPHGAALRRDTQCDRIPFAPFPGAGRSSMICLLYTSDAADERSSVDLGGRRIINKKQVDERKEDTRQSKDENNRVNTHRI